MAVVRWTFPAASVSDEVRARMLAWDGSSHVIYVNKAKSSMSVREDGGNIVMETRAEAPLDNLKSHLRYMIAWALGGKEESEAEG